MFRTGAGAKAMSADSANSSSARRCLSTAMANRSPACMLAWTYANTSEMTYSPDARQLAQIKAALFLVCLLPLARLLWAAYTGDFGPNPVEFVQRWTGTWTINLLLLTLCVTPLRAYTQMHWLTRLRRMLGLFCFFYAVLHFLCFIGFDHDFVIDDIA